MNFIEEFVQDVRLGLRMLRRGICGDDPGVDRSVFPAARLARNANRSNSSTTNGMTSYGHQI